jgi:cytoskeletal protein RodZ
VSPAFLRSMPPPTRQKMTRSEAARHAARVRYGKEHALDTPTAANVQARAAEILAKLRAKGQPKGKAKAKGGKGKAAKPKDARTPQEKANQNRASVAKQTGLGDLEGTVVARSSGCTATLRRTRTIS